MNKVERHKLRWDCEKKGCFNYYNRPRLEIFADCFPGDIAFGDIDGAVEINGYELRLEWKPTRDISRGQKIMFERLSKTVVTTIVVSGTIPTMFVESFCIFSEGQQSKWKYCGGNIEKLTKFIKAWVKIVQAAKRPTGVKYE